MLDAKTEDAIIRVIRALDEHERSHKSPAGWSPEEDRKLTQMWGKRTQYYIARRLNRPRASVKWRARKLNLEMRHAA